MSETRIPPVGGVSPVVVPVQVVPEATAAGTASQNDWNKLFQAPFSTGDTLELDEESTIVHQRIIDAGKLVSPRHDVEQPATKPEVASEAIAQTASQSEVAREKKERQEVLIQMSRDADARRMASTPATPVLDMEFDPETVATIKEVAPMKKRTLWAVAFVAVILGCILAVALFFDSDPPAPAPAQSQGTSAAVSAADTGQFRDLVRQIEEVKVVLAAVQRELSASAAVAKDVKDLLKDVSDIKIAMAAAPRQEVFVALAAEVREQNRRIERVERAQATLPNQDAAAPVAKDVEALDKKVSDINLALAAVQKAQTAADASKAKVAELANRVVALELKAPQVQAQAPSATAGATAAEQARALLKNRVAVILILSGVGVLGLMLIWLGFKPSPSQPSQPG